MATTPDPIESLREALALSPDNLPLRVHLGELLLGKGEGAEAEAVFAEGLKAAPASEQLKHGLARAFDVQGRTSQAIVLLEDLAGRPDAAGEVLLMLAQLLLREGELSKASSAYRRAIDRSPELADESLAAALGVGAAGQATDDDYDVDEQGRVMIRAGSTGATVPIEMERPEMSFDDVGGMDALKDEIRLKIIEPLKNPDIYKAYGKSTGGGILMYGPPGCGKTFLARATAGEVSAAFIAVGIHDVLDMYHGNSEAKLHSLFEYARQHTPCVLFFDEVDALGAKRSDMQQGAGRQLINQFLSELDGVQDSNDGLLVLAATNAPWHLDSAFRRPGRFDRIIFVPPPDADARAQILRLMLKGKPQESIDAELIAKKAADFSGADLKAVVDTAVEEKLKEALKSGVPGPLSTKELAKAAKRMKPSTREWFSTARNYALYSNEGGAYDDILEFLKIKK